MPDYRGANLPSGTYFFTLNPYRGQTFLTDADVRTALREAIGTIGQTHPFRIDTSVLLPDHLHALWPLPPDNHNFSHRWRVVKRLVTQGCAARLHRPECSTERRRQRYQSTLWQHRFWEHPIRDEDDANRHVDYLHWNPVKHGDVREVKDWPYSSFHRYVKRGLLPLAWGSTMLFFDGDTFGERMGADTLAG